MPSVKIKRGTRAQINAAAGANGLAAGEPYLIVDESRFAVGTAANAYQAMAKEGEGGSGGAQQVYVQQTQPSAGAFPWVWLETDAGGNPLDIAFYNGVP